MTRTKTQAPAPDAGRRELPIIDHSNLQFRQDVEWCLATLKTYAPDRYREVIQHLDCLLARPVSCLLGLP